MLSYDLPFPLLLLDDLDDSSPATVEIARNVEPEDMFKWGPGYPALRVPLTEVMPNIFPRYTNRVYPVVNGPRQGHSGAAAIGPLLVEEKRPDSVEQTAVYVGDQYD